MTYLTLEIQDKIDLNLLLPLLNRLHIKYSESVAPQIDTSKKMSEEVKVFLLNGLPEKENFDEWVTEWNISRKDREMPFREN